MIELRADLDRARAQLRGGKAIGHARSRCRAAHARHWQPWIERIEAELAALAAQTEVDTMNRNQTMDTGAAYLDLLNTDGGIAKGDRGIENGSRNGRCTKGLAPDPRGLAPQNTRANRHGIRLAGRGNRDAVDDDVSHAYRCNHHQGASSDGFTADISTVLLAGQVGGQRARKGIVHPGEPGAAEAEAQWKAQRARKGIGRPGYNGWIFSGTVD